MTASANVVAAVFVLLVVVVYVLHRRTTSRGRPRARRRSGGVGTGAMGAVYDLLNEDKRRAIEIIVEEKAEERRPEYPDGDLPQLEDPQKQKKRR